VRLERLGEAKKSNDLIGNQTGDFPAYSIVPQPTTLPHVPCWSRVGEIYLIKFSYNGNRDPANESASLFKTTYQSSLLKSLTFLAHILRTTQRDIMTEMFQILLGYPRLIGLDSEDKT
jgi:hypothetical protein